MFSRSGEKPLRQPDATMRCIGDLAEARFPTEAEHGHEKDNQGRRRHRGRGKESEDRNGSLRSTSRRGVYRTASPRSLLARD